MDTKSHSLTRQINSEFIENVHHIVLKVLLIVVKVKMSLNVFSNGH